MVPALFLLLDRNISQLPLKGGMGPGGAGTEGALPLPSSAESSFLFCHHSTPPHTHTLSGVACNSPPFGVPVTDGFQVVLLLRRLEGV